MNQKDLSEFKRTLEKIGLPQTRAAVILGINPQYLNRVLIGSSRPSEDLYKAILEFHTKLKKSGLIAV